MFLRMGPIGTGLPPKRCTTLFSKGFGDSNQASIPPTPSGELDHMHWGVEMARKGGIPPDRVINAMPLAKLLRHLHNRRQPAARAA